MVRQSRKKDKKSKQPPAEDVETELFGGEEEDEGAEGSKTLRELEMMYCKGEQCHACMAKDCKIKIVAEDHHMLCNKHLPPEHILNPPTKQCKACEELCARTHRRRKRRMEAFQQSGVWPTSTPTKTPAKSEGSAPSTTLQSTPLPGKGSVPPHKSTPAPTTSQGPDKVSTEGDVVVLDEDVVMEGEAMADEHGSDRQSGDNDEGDNDNDDHDGDQGDNQGDGSGDDGHDDQNDNDEEEDDRSGDPDDDGDEDEDEVHSDGASGEESSEEEESVEEIPVESKPQPIPKRPIPKRPSVPKPNPSPKKPHKSTLEHAKELKRLKKQKKLLKKQLQLKKLKKQLKKSKHSKKSKKSFSSDSSSDSSSSDSDSEDSLPPPKRPKKNPKPSQPDPQPFDQAAMVAQIMSAMKTQFDSFTQAKEKQIEERMKRIEAQSAGPVDESIPQKEVPPLVGQDAPSLGQSVQSKVPSTTQLPKSLVHSSSVEDKSKDEESDDESSNDIRTSKDSHKRRRDTFQEVLQDTGMFVFEVPSVSRDTSQAQAQFGHVEAPIPTDTLNVQKGMLDELQKHALRRLEKGYKKPDKLLNKMYKIPSGQKANWSQPPRINQHLLNVVNHNFRVYDKQKKMWALNPKHTTGQEEKLWLEVIARQQLILRIINCQTMALAASQACVYQVSNEMKQLDSLCEDQAFNISQWFHVASKTLDKAFETTSEAQVNAVDLLKLSADSWFKAMEERRRLWLQSSRLNQDQQAQLNALSLNLPSIDLTDPEWGILDEATDNQVKNWSELYHQDRNLSASNILLKFQKDRAPSVKNVKGQSQGHKPNKNTKPNKPFPATASGSESAAGSVQGKPGGGTKSKPKQFKRTYKNKQNPKSKQ
jgi:DNA-binding transcriptional MerR regulator